MVDNNYMFAFIKLKTPQYFLKQQNELNELADEKKAIRPPSPRSSLWIPVYLIL